MAASTHKTTGHSQPWLHQQGIEIQEFGTVRQFPLGLSEDARRYSCQRLNQILADTQILYGLYKKHHWVMRGATFYQLHLLLDKHAEEQEHLVDDIAERVQALGGVAVGDPRHVAEITAHDASARTAELGDDGTNDLLVSQVIRTGERQAWFLSEHLVPTSLVRSLTDARPRTP